MKPNLVNIRKWVEALESGAFEQTTGTLCRTDDGALSYCCLGVACEVAMADGVKLAKTAHYPTVQDDDPPAIRAQFTYRSEEIFSDNSQSELPSVVAEWLGVSRNPVLHMPRDLPVSLNVSLCTAANDDLGLSFTQIASAIRATYLSEEVAGEVGEDRDEAEAAA